MTSIAFVDNALVASLDSTSPVPMCGSTALSIPASPATANREHAALLAMIIERMCLYKADLYWYYVNVDARHTGMVGTSDSLLLTIFRRVCRCGLGDLL